MPQLLPFGPKWPHLPKYILLYFLCSCFIGAKAQILEFKKFIQEDNCTYIIEDVPFHRELQEFESKYIFKDKEGFIWFCGNQGLLRYDGARIRNYTYEQFDQNVTPLASITIVIQDPNDFMWFGTSQGMVKYNPNNGKFKLYFDLEPPDKHWDWNVVTYLKYDDGSIWLATRRGLSRFDIQGEVFDRHIRFSPDKYNELAQTIHDLYLSSSEALYLRNGLEHIVYNKKEDSYKILENSPPSWCSFYRDNVGNIWLGSYSGLFLFDSINSSFTKVLDDPEDPESLDRTVVSYIKQDSDGGYWIGVDDGFFKYSKDFKKEYFWKVAPGETAVIFLISDGVVWLSTSQGIKKIIKKPINFAVKPKIESKVNSSISFINFYNNSFWIRVDRMVYKYSVDFNSYESFKVGSDIISETGTRPTLSGMMFDRSGRLWLATLNMGVYVCENLEFDPNFVRRFPGSGVKSDLPSPKVLRLFEDSSGRIWMGTDFHFPCYYDPTLDKLFNVEFIDLPGKEENLPMEIVVQMEIDSGLFLATTNQGIIAFSANTIKTRGNIAEISEYIDFKLRYKSFTGEEAYHLIELFRPKFSDPNSLWASTWNRGLLHVKIGGTELTNDLIKLEEALTVEEGFLSNQQYSILEDSTGLLWIGSKKGLIKLNPANGNFSTFTSQDGLISNQFNKQAATIGPDGHFYYGAEKAVISFSPYNIVFNTRVPPVKITDILVNDIDVLKDSSLSEAFYSKKKALRLNYKQTNIDIEFAALNYIHPDHNQYKYKLEGKDEKWISLGNQPFVKFYSLKPGRYNFHVIGSNNDGIWNEEGATINFVISKPPWFSFPAIIAYALILFLAGFLFRRYILFRANARTAIEMEKLEKEKMREVDELKSRFFTNISHEFRTPLTLIMGPVRDLEKQGGDNLSIKRDTLEILGRNARRLLLLINQLLDISKLEKHALKQNIVSGNLAELIQITASSFESLAESQKIKFIVNIDTCRNQACFDPDKVEKILVNLLSNAFKFTPGGGEIHLEFYYQTKSGDKPVDTAVLQVQDSGKGIDSDQIERIFDRFYQVPGNGSQIYEGTGIGLSLIKELVELMHGDIEVESSPGTGSTFKVTFPISEDCFSEDEFLSVGTIDEGKKELSDTESEGLNSEFTEPKSMPENVILVVEDNIDLRTYISKQFIDIYQVEEEGNGKAGFEKALEILPDLIISDLMMPVMGGLELCKKLKEHPLTNHIPVIILTAKADMDSKLEGLEAAADDYIIKPFDSEELLARTKNLISQRKELRKSFERSYLNEDPDTPAASRQYIMLREFMKVLDEHISEPEIKVEDLAVKLNMSRSQLFRKINSVAGTTPNQLIRLERMKRAAKFLREGEMNVTQVMYQVGIRNPSYFARSFKKYYGVNPGEYLRNKR